MEHGVFNAFEISASGLAAQRQRLDAIADNIANAQTTRTAEGGPYRRRQITLGESPDRPRFLVPSGGEPPKVPLAASSPAHLPLGLPFPRYVHGGAGVVVSETRGEGTRLVNEPGHPDADENGMVAYPDISVVQEMIDMILASRAYEANVTAIQSTKAMIQSALEI